MIQRRRFVQALMLSGAFGCGGEGGEAITRVEVVRYKGAQGEADHLEIESSSGIVGVFGTLGWGLGERLNSMRPDLAAQLVGADPADGKLGFPSLWTGLFPEADLSRFARGVEPIEGSEIWGTTRDGRHNETGLKIMALSAVDNALWDLRGKLAKVPAYQLMGEAGRSRLRVYSRVGEGKDLEEARRTARERFDQGQRHQKWYFVHGPKDGKEGLHACLELVRVLREELPDAELMFDNHSMRHEIGPDWVVELAKGMMQYTPFWLEEPTAPEDTEGYARIKGETGITVAAGEHHFTRWQILPLLDRKCIDWVQSDPDWCGGISEWLEICRMTEAYPGVHVVPHCDNFMTGVQCVASQPESLCPFAEYNDGQTERKMSYRTRILRPEREEIDTPAEFGLGPDLDRDSLSRVA